MLWWRVSAYLVFGNRIETCASCLILHMLGQSLRKAYRSPTLLHTHSCSCCVLTRLCSGSVFAQNEIVLAYLDLVRMFCMRLVITLHL